MPFPDFIQSFPGIDVPFPDDVVQTAVMRSGAGLVAFFTFLKDMQLQTHAHGAQITSGTRVIEVFKEPDRYKPKA